jgi:hypothetical protein
MQAVTLVKGFIGSAVFLPVWQLINRNKMDMERKCLIIELKNKDLGIRNQRLTSSQFLIPIFPIQCCIFPGKILLACILPKAILLLKPNHMIITKLLIKGFRLVLFFLAFMLYLSLLFSCKKEVKIKDNPTNPGNEPPPVGNANCSPIKANAENIALFPADNPWRMDISASAVDTYSSQIIAGFSTTKIKADFGSGLWEGAPIGIPYIVVCSNQPKVPANYTDYGDESDPGPFPIPLNAPIEGNGEGDSHVIAVDIENGMLYELFYAHVNGNRWDASSGAVFNLNSNALRPAGWTSADAAGLPIFPGLVRYEEILKGEIDHPIRFTLGSSLVKPAYIHPARHKVNSSGGQYTLPFGARIRLKASFDISTYSATNQIILRAMKKYGLILADIGSNLYITGAPDDRWSNSDLQKLGQLMGSDFEVVKFNN